MAPKSRADSLDTLSSDSDISASESEAAPSEFHGLSSPSATATSDTTSESDSDSDFEPKRDYRVQLNSRSSQALSNDDHSHFFSQKNDQEVVSRSRLRAHNSGLTRPTQPYDYNGVLWSIIGWRWTDSENNVNEFLIRYSSPTPNPGAAGDYVCALVAEDKMPVDLRESYKLTKQKELDSLKHPSFGRSWTHVECIQSIAWNSKGKGSFKTNRLWDSFISRASRVEDFEKSSEFKKFLNGIFGEIRWRSGETTWESGHSLVKIMTVQAFLQTLPKIVARTQQKWKRIQSAKGERPVIEGNDTSSSCPARMTEAQSSSRPECKVLEDAICSGIAKLHIGKKGTN